MCDQLDPFLFTHDNAATNCNNPVWFYKWQLIGAFVVVAVAREQAVDVSKGLPPGKLSRSVLCGVEYK